VGPLPWRQSILGDIIVGLDHLNKSISNLNRKGISNKNDYPGAGIGWRLLRRQGVEIRLYI